MQSVPHLSAVSDTMETTMNKIKEVHNIVTISKYHEDEKYVNAKCRLACDLLTTIMQSVRSNGLLCDFDSTLNEMQNACTSFSDFYISRSVNIAFVETVEALVEVLISQLKNKVNP